ncbi:MAG TPA: hypothetical protein VI913_05495 [Candidatus Peribacteraceae bacterium]|nr:hypothetical protein [Candidatus Peribacteraceae bacterium]
MSDHNSGPHHDAAAGAQKQLAALEGWMAPLFAKAPHIPKNGRDMLVQIAPWLALIFGVLGVLGSISAMGILSSFALPYMVGYGMNGALLTVALFVSLVASVLEVMAWKPLSEHKKKGWNYLFYGVVLTTIATILQMFFGYGNVGGIIGALIGFWLLFEVRGMYHA